MKPQTHIQKLITQLSESPIEDYNAVLKDFDFSLIDFTDFESWSSKHYTRNCIYRDSNFELLLLCWNPNQATAIHGHDGEDCWVYLLEGEIEEVYYAYDDSSVLRQVNSQKYEANELSFMNDRLGFHKLKNVCKGKSLSLHLYAKPIDNCVCFDERSQVFNNRELSYDTHKQLLLKD
ncbi:cysteine dioxygenase [Psychroserpens algicola]|uniref:cysteine dioxygenase n=1 Tax=Psychroserpens algicola TaxID=1719034 RepID=UPI0019535F44|nr:cysteine dioxygenase family protein [Psychroserpens algicola]